MSDNIESGDSSIVFPGTTEQITTTMIIPTENKTLSSSSSVISMEAASDFEFSEAKVECRFCQEKYLLSHLEAPCACSGTLKPYVLDYVESEPRSSNETAIDIRDRWPITRNVMNQLQFPLLQVERDADRVASPITQEYCESSNSTREIFRVVILMLVIYALVILHFWMIIYMVNYWLKYTKTH